MTNALVVLDRAVAARNVAGTRIAAIESARAALDFRLMYRPVAEVNRARLDLWAAEAIADAATGNVGFVRGDVASAEYVWARIAAATAPALRAAVDGHLREMRVRAESRALALVAAAAVRLRAALAAE